MPAKQHVLSFRCVAYLDCMSYFKTDKYCYSVQVCDATEADIISLRLVQKNKKNNRPLALQSCLLCTTAFLQEYR